MGDKVLGAVVTVGLLVATGGGFAAFSFLGVSSFAGAALAVGVLTAASFVLEALGPNPPGGVVQAGSRDYRQVVRQPVVPARWIYGRARVAGVLCYINDYTSGSGGDTESDSIQYVNPKSGIFMGLDPTDKKGRTSSSGTALSDSDLSRTTVRTADSSYTTTPGNPTTITYSDAVVEIRDHNKIIISPSIFGRWTLPEGWVDSEHRAFLDRFEITNDGQVEVYTRSQNPPDYDSADFISAVESDLQFTLADGNDTIDITLTSADDTAPYIFTPTNVAAVRTWVGNREFGDSISITLETSSGVDPTTTPSTTTSTVSGLNRLGGSEGLFMVLALTEGEMDDIEAIWVDGTRMPFTEESGIISPSVSESGDVKFKQEGEDAIKFYMHRGEQAGSALQRRWGRNDALTGISAVGVELAQYEDKPWSKVPNVEFLVRGVRITWPGQPTPTWTENAAAVRWHYYVFAKGVPTSYIDDLSVRSAINVCGERFAVATTTDSGGTTSTVHELRYSINGMVADDEGFDSVVSHMDYAWAGSAPEINGMITFRPGAPGVARTTITSDDLVEEDEPTWQIETPIFQQADALDASIAHSATNEWLEFSLPRYGSTELDAVVENVGSIQYVAYIDTAERLLQWQLKHINAQRRAGLRLVGGDNLNHYHLNASDRIIADLPEMGINNQRFYVERVQYGFDGTLALEVVEEPSNLFDSSFLTILDYVEDTIHHPVLQTPTNLSYRTQLTEGDITKRDVFVFSDESTDGTNLQVRFRYGPAQSWLYEGKGSTIRGVTQGTTIYVSARLSTGTFNSDWTTDETEGGLLIVQIPTDPELPVLTLSGRTVYLEDQAVSVTITYALKENSRTATYTAIGKPSFLTESHTPNTGTGDDGNVGTIMFTGTFPSTIGTNETTVQVTDSTNASSSISFSLSLAETLELTPPSNITISRSASRVVATLSATGGATPYTYSLDSPPTGVTITDNVVSAQIDTLGTYTVNVVVDDASGQQDTGSFQIEVVTPRNFGIGETNPLVLAWDASDSKLYMGGADTNRIYGLNLTYFTVSDNGAPGLPSNSERMAEDGGTMYLATNTNLLSIDTISENTEIVTQTININSSYLGYMRNGFDVESNIVYAVFFETENSGADSYNRRVCHTEPGVPTKINPNPPDVTVCTNVSVSFYQTTTRRLKLLRYNVDTGTLVGTSTIETSTISRTYNGTSLVTTGSNNSYNIKGVAVESGTIFIYMIRNGTKAIYRVNGALNGIVHVTDRSDGEVEDITATSSYIYILDYTDKQVNRYTR